MSLFFKGIILLCIFLILLGLNLHYYACYQTTLLPGVYLHDGSSIVKTNNWSVPIVYDWDSDEKKDLLVGNSYIDEKNINHGYVSFYKNIGSDAAPIFNGATYIQTCTDKCSLVNVAALG
ncbi:MAG: hypothetical protein Q8N09_04360 [Thermodesulfovibrionia bacterium]|nr:hypothetical protein [Thermodesulfovibrionia bacterium]